MMTGQELEEAMAGATDEKEASSRPKQVQVSHPMGPLIQREIFEKILSY